MNFLSWVNNMEIIKKELEGVFIIKNKILQYEIVIFIKKYNKY